MSHSNPWLESDPFTINQFSSLTEVTDIFRPPRIAKLQVITPPKKIHRAQNQIIPVVIIKPVKVCTKYETLGQRNETKNKQPALTSSTFGDSEFSYDRTFQPRKTLLPALPPPYPISIKYPKAIKIQEVRRKYKSLESLPRIMEEDVQKLIITVDHLKYIFPPIHPNNR